MKVSILLVVGLIAIVSAQDITIQEEPAPSLMMSESLNADGSTTTTTTESTQ
jgi:hypothetical protein